MRRCIDKKIWILVGTRPEVIKQTPLYFACVDKFGKDSVALVGTGQHRELLEQALAHFRVTLDFNMDIMTAGQTLTASSAAVLAGLDQLFSAGRPEWLVVQGDTTSAAMAGWAAFQYGVKVAHNEAGLRTYDLLNPFPEEANRRLISVIASRHFAPTELARQTLLAEHIKPDLISVVGNTGIDALRLTLDAPKPGSISKILEEIRSSGLQPVLLTAHRRENKGQGMENWFRALAHFLQQHEDLAMVYPCHPNNSAREAADRFLAPLSRVFMLPAINYGETCHLLNHCRLVVTDSGGIQEEGSTLGVPVVVCRKTSERMEAVHAGLARVAGTDVDSIMEAMEWAYSKGRTAGHGIQNTVFGDGFSSGRIADLLA